MKAYVNLALVITSVLEVDHLNGSSLSVDGKDSFLSDPCYRPSCQFDRKGWSIPLPVREGSSIEINVPTGTFEGVVTDAGHWQRREEIPQLGNYFKVYAGVLTRILRISGVWEGSEGALFGGQSGVGQWWVEKVEGEVESSLGVFSSYEEYKEFKRGEKAFSTLGHLKVTHHQAFAEMVEDGCCF